MLRGTIPAQRLWLFALLTLCGCQIIGPNSIGAGRDRYNSILQSTAMEQTMSNIVRVYRHEPTLFMDVTEVDSTLSIGASLNASATNIGADSLRTATSITNGRTGSTGGAIQYSETPTIRYQPLLGQPLVAQLVTPVSVDALGLLYDSSWPAAPLLDFASAYLTLDYGEFYSAFNTIIELDDMGAIELAASKSDLTKATEPEKAAVTPSEAGARGPSSSSKSSSGNNNDALVIYLRPFHPHSTADNLAEKRRVLQLWVRLLRIYAKTQPNFMPTVPALVCERLKLSMGRLELLRHWDVDIDAMTKDQIDDARGCLPSQVELRIVPAPAAEPNKKGGSAGTEATELVSRAPLMRTYSALGILKAATERPHPKIEFVTPARYREIRDPATHGWNDDPDTLSYYTLLPADEDSIDCPEAIRKQKGGCDNPGPGGAKGDEFDATRKELARWIMASAEPNTEPAKAKPAGAVGGDEDLYHGLFVYEATGSDVLDDKYARINQQLGLLRRYILVVVDDVLPIDTPYVAYSGGGRWYYIASDDTVSQKNFHLLSLFLTMMATPPTTQPLSPVINVGG